MSRTNSHLPCDKSKCKKQPSQKMKAFWPERSSSPRSVDTQLRDTRRSTVNRLLRHQVAMGQVFLELLNDAKHGQASARWVTRRLFLPPRYVAQLALWARAFPVNDFDVALELADDSRWELSADKIDELAKIDDPRELALVFAHAAIEGFTIRRLRRECFKARSRVVLESADLALTAQKSDRSSKRSVAVSTGHHHSKT